MKSVNVDVVAAVLIIQGKQAELARLAANIDGKQMTCQDCGCTEDRDIVRDGFGGREYMCERCGMLQTVEELELDDLGLTDADVGE